LADHPNERVGIVGGNGTGKSTLLKVLAGLEQLDHGTLSPPRARASATFRRKV
jgi:ATPase subunit of ABC transporter with duplicated ATPase domains